MTRPTVDDPRVTRALGESALLRMIDTAIASVWVAAGQSHTVTAVTRAYVQWHQQPHHERLTMVGVALLTASVVHLGLIVTQETPPGWLWLVPPAIAATIGLLLLLGARSGVKA